MSYRMDGDDVSRVLAAWRAERAAELAAEAAANPRTPDKPNCIRSPLVDLYVEKARAEKTLPSEVSS